MTCTRQPLKIGQPHGHATINIFFLKLIFFIIVSFWRVSWSSHCRAQLCVTNSLRKTIKSNLALQTWLLFNINRTGNHWFILQYRVTHYQQKTRIILSRNALQTPSHRLRRAPRWGIYLHSRDHRPLPSRIRRLYASYIHLRLLDRVQQTAECRFQLVHWTGSQRRVRAKSKHRSRHSSCVATDLDGASWLGVGRRPPTRQGFPSTAYCRCVHHCFLRCTTCAVASRVDCRLG